MDKRIAAKGVQIDKCKQRLGRTIYCKAVNEKFRIFFNKNPENERKNCVLKEEQQQQKQHGSQQQ